MENNPTQGPPGLFLVLYRRLPDYFFRCLAVFSRLSGVEVWVVRQAPDPLSPFQLPTLPGMVLKDRNEWSSANLQEQLRGRKIVGAYVSGWGDPLYKQMAKQLKSRSIPVILGLDNQWNGSFRQRVASLLSRWAVRPFFSHVWVAGSFQFEYARRLGYDRKQILMGVYSADVDRYSLPAAGEMARRFVYVGRMVKEKGIDLMVEAFQRLEAEGYDWPLLAIGSGPMEGLLAGSKLVEHRPFAQPDQLREEMQAGGVFLLPSHQEPWGVVVHEFAAAGYPLILSDAVGAQNAFLRPGYNGWVFAAGDPDSLLACLKTAMSQQANLPLMGERSKALAQSITPASWAHLLIDTLGLDPLPHEDNSR